MKNNIPKIYLASFFLGLIFFYGIERLFLFSLGATASSITLIVALLAGIILLFDIPFGVIADKIGRKFTFIFSALSMLTATLIYSNASTIEHYAFGVFFQGMFIVGLSGTAQAFIYDTLHSLGRSKEYNKILGRSMAFLFAGIGIALFLSGFIADTYGFRFNFQITVIPLLLSILIVLTTKEPKYHKPVSMGLSEHIKTSIKTITYNDFLKKTSLIFLTLSMMLWMMIEFSQFIFNDFELSLKLVSINSGLAVVAGAIGRAFAHKLERYFKYILIITLLIYSLIGFGPYFGVLFALIICYGLIQLLLNIAETEIQHTLPSHLRATTMSTFSSFVSLFGISGGILISIILKYQSIFIVFRYVLMLAVISSAIWLIFLQKDKFTSNN